MTATTRPQGPDLTKHDAPSGTRVTVDRAADLAPPRPRIGIGSSTPEERFIRWGSFAGGYAAAWIVCRRLLPLDGLAWFVIVGFVLSIAVIAVATWVTDSSVVVRDRVATAIVTGGAALVGVALLSVIVFIVQRGYRPLLHLNFIFEDMAAVGPRDPFDRGGVAHAIVGSLIQVGIAVAITVPLGVGTAVYMTEVGGRFARLVRTVVEAMTALPSIVAGLFVYTVGIITLGLPRSGLCAALALGVMMLPIIARASDVVLRVVPSGLREASLALGASRWKTVWNVVLPTARPGLATALILGVARGIGETSPVLITSGAASFMVKDPTEGVMNSLPLFIYTTVRSGEPLAIQRAFATATVLLLLVLALFVTARLLARPRRDRPSLFRRLRQRILPPQRHQEIS